MKSEDLDKAIDEMKSSIAGQNQKEINEKVSLLKKEMEEKISESKDNVREELQKEYLAEMKNVRDEYDKALEEKQKHLDAMDIRIKQNVSKKEEKGERFIVSMADAIKENYDKIKLVRKGASASMEIKAVADMTLGNNLTGASILTYQQGIAGIPSQAVNFADLVPTVGSATGTYIIYRETGAEGSISNQTEGASKTQKDYDIAQVTYNADYRSGFARFSKQMATDLPFLTSWLPGALRRDYFKVENGDYHTSLVANAVKATNTLTTGIERIINDIGLLESTDYVPTGVLLNPIDWANIANTKPSDFSLPRVVEYVNGTLVVHGVPVFKASWVTAGTYFIAEWNMAKKVVVDGLAVEFFEQDADNVTKNLITARVESRNVLAYDRLEAFIYGNLTGAQPV
jgi:HK97 family phage major capsid protein